MADIYRLTVTAYPQEMSIGAKCVRAQQVYGLMNASPTVTVKVTVHGNNYKSHEAEFKLPVS